MMLIEALGPIFGHTGKQSSPIRKFLYCLHVSCGVLIREPYDCPFLTNKIEISQIQYVFDGVHGTGVLSLPELAHVEGPQIVPSIGSIYSKNGIEAVTGPMSGRAPHNVLFRKIRSWPDEQVNAITALGDKAL
jgi:hypothetical protein